MNVDKNDERRDGAHEIQSAESRVKILVVPTNEESEIALETVEVIESKS